MKPDSISMPKLLFIMVIALAAASTACEGEECREQRTIEKIEERNKERVDDWMDTAEAYDRQRERVAELTQELRPDRLKLERMRERSRDQILDELLKKKPDVKVMHGMIDKTKTKMMPYNYKVIDQVMKAHPAFTTEQRSKIRDKMAEPPDPFEISFIVKTGIDYVLYSIDATDPQKTYIWGQINGTVTEINGLIKKQHKVTVAIGDEWAKKDAKYDVIKAHVDDSANRFTGFIKSLTTKAVDLTAQLTPKQREYTNDRIRRGKTCPAK